MMGSKHSKATNFHATGRFYANRFNMLDRDLVVETITLSERARWIIESLRINLFFIGSVIRAYPTHVLVMATIWKGKSKTRIPAEIPSFIAMQMALVHLTRTEEWQMRIDEQHGMPGLTL